LGLVPEVPEGRKIFSELTVMKNLRLGSCVKGAKKDRKSNIDWILLMQRNYCKTKNFMLYVWSMDTAT
jgi:ABC-type branched-subunit amino acid transport system ATPase component